MEPAERFAQNLQNERYKADLTQEELATRAGLHRTEVSLLERAGREPRLSTIVALSRALGISPIKLLRGIS